MSLSEACAIAEQYQLSYLRRVGSLAVTAPHEQAALWSLAALCFFGAPLKSPVQFVHDYLRWLQFHYSGSVSRANI